MDTRIETSSLIEPLDFSVEYGNHRLPDFHAFPEPDENDPPGEFVIVCKGPDGTYYIPSMPYYKLSPVKDADGKIVGFNAHDTRPISRVVIHGVVDGYADKV